MWRKTAPILRQFIAQEHDTDMTVAVSDCGIFHTQNIYVCSFVRNKLDFIAVVFSLIISVIFIKSTCCPHILQNLKMLTILTLKCVSSTICTVNHLSVTVSVLSSIAPLSPTVFLCRYYVCLCPAAWMKVGLLWIGYEKWWFCSLLKSFQSYKLTFRHRASSI